MDRSSLRMVFLLLPLAGPGPARAEDAKLLRAAGVPSDGPGLLALLKKCTPSPADDARIRALVGQLGAGDFAQRQKASDALIALGPAALPALREAGGSKDLEVRRRARACRARLERLQAPGLMSAVVRQIARLAPAGAGPALLAYLPSADEEVFPGVVRALWQLARRGGPIDPAVVRALQDEHPRRRAAAGLVVAGAGNAEQRRSAARLLTDSNPRVRLHVVRGILLAKGRKGIPLLVETLAVKDPAVAAEAEGLLAALAGDSAPKTDLGSTPEEREHCRRAWEDWRKAHADKVHLADEAKVLFANPALRAERIAGRFLRALLEGDKELVRKMTALPFRMAHQRFTKAEEVERWAGEVHGRTTEKKYTSRVAGKPVPVRKAPPFQAGSLKKAYADLPWAELYLVPAEAVTGTGNREAIFVVVRVGGKTGVVGVGSGTGPPKGGR